MLDYQILAPAETRTWLSTLVMVGFSGLCWKTALCKDELVEILLEESTGLLMNREIRTCDCSGVSEMGLLFNSTDEKAGAPVSPLMSTPPRIDFLRVTGIVTNLKPEALNEYEN